MIRFAAEILTRSPEQGARTVALGLLDEAASALSRVGDASDSEALHDFRVNLRRLRSCLRAYLPYLHRRASEQALRSIRDLAGHTNAARDYEVQIDWLRDQRDALRPTHRTALSTLIGDLESRRQSAYASVLEGVPETFDGLRDKLRPKLEAYRTWIRLDAEAAADSFAETSAVLLRSSINRLESLLQEIRSPADEAQAHQARIQAKRLRYLLEPLSPHVDGGKPALKQLKALQDVLGELNDTAVLRQSLATRLEQAALLRAQQLLAAVRERDDASQSRARRAVLENGILAIARLVEERRHRLFADLAAKWLGPQGSALFVDFEAIAKRLSEIATRHLEIERKFLLKSLPEATLGAPHAEIEQGWLPGTEVRERLRRVRARGRERFFRTLKVGSGVRRSEFEEEISAELFQKLWPATAGSRVRKQRFTVGGEDHTWEIDNFADRDLVLAEVELPSEAAELTLPSWLSPHVEREVTGEPQYLNVNLAG